VSDCGGVSCSSLLLFGSHSDCSQAETPLIPPSRFPEPALANLWRPDDTKIITLEGEDIGWVEFRRTGDELFLKKLYITPEHQRQGIGSQVIRLLNEQATTAKSMALFVLRNNPAYRFYERHGFEVVQETHTTLVMRRALAEAA
jgi:ribosomal protein S18 acetylase RimI-like enzyme